MRVDTALTAFSATTLLIIVALVINTATELQITRFQSTGNFYAGDPKYGVVERESLPLTMVENDPESPSCYADGINECRRMNAGENFVQCSQQVAIDCSKTDWMRAGCYLPPGFELKYSNNRNCVYGVVDECKIRCSLGLQEICNRLSTPRCGLIGGKFTNVYEQTLYTGYGMRE